MKFEYKHTDINDYIDSCICNSVCDYVSVHIVNDGNIMGSGLAKTLYERFPDVKNNYHLWAKYSQKHNPFKLGRIQVVDTEYDNLTIVNMVAQSDCGGYKPKNGPHLPPIRYQSLVECLYRLKDYILSKYESLPAIFSGLIGCDRAGGDMKQIKKIVWQVFGDTDIWWTWLSYDEDQLNKFKSISMFS
jgi:hypothetical protein